MVPGSNRPDLLEAVVFKVARSPRRKLTERLTQS
jgi:hypothetical protein